MEIAKSISGRLGDQLLPTCCPGYINMYVNEMQMRAKY